MRKELLPVQARSYFPGILAVQGDPALAELTAAGKAEARLLGQETLVSRQAGPIWNDPILATVTATVAVTLLLAGVWLFRRRSRGGRGAALVCLIVSLILHLGLIVLLPQLKMFGGSGDGPQAE